MASNKLDKIGLSQVWAKVVACFVGKEDGKGLSSNDYTTAEKQKLEGIAEGANKTVVDSTLSDTSTNPVQNKAVKAELDKKLASAQKGAANGVAGLDAEGKVPTEQLPAGLPADGGNADTVNGHTVEANVPANAKFTDTVYTHPNSGVAAGTYKSLTVDAHGHVTGGTNPSSLSGYGITDAYTKAQADTAIKNAVDAAVAGIYKFKGSVAFASLPTTNVAAGDTYNITDAFTTTASFVEGAGKSYPAGTNVSYTDGGKWDCMAGIYDFSDFMMKDDLVSITAEEIDEICVMPTV